MRSIWAGWWKILSMGRASSRGKAAHLLGLTGRVRSTPPGLPRLTTDQIATFPPTLNRGSWESCVTKMAVVQKFAMSWPFELAWSHGSHRHSVPFLSLLSDPISCKVSPTLSFPPVYACYDRGCVNVLWTNARILCAKLHVSEVCRNSKLLSSDSAYGDAWLSFW